MESIYRDSFEITTSIRSDGILARKNGTNSLDQISDFGHLYMLHLHRDRMLAATEAFNWPQAAKTEVFTLEKHLSAHLRTKYNDKTYSKPLKVRMTLSYNGTINVTSISVPTASLTSLLPTSFSEILALPPTFHIFVSPFTTIPSLFTVHKTTNRALYNDIRSLLPDSSWHSKEKSAALPAEILLVNDRREIMEGSLTTPYLLREGRWITPAAKCGGNLGTTRRYALTQGLCKEGIVLRESVQVGERIVLSNGVRGFGWGSVEKLEKP